MEAFVAALAEAFARHRLPLQADPKRSIFRIYRDTRFAKDKSPHHDKPRTGDAREYLPSGRAATGWRRRPQ
jgi:uncharacterized protein (DUF2461 family)